MRRGCRICASMSAAAQIILVQNSFDELKRLVPTP